MRNKLIHATLSIGLFLSVGTAQAAPKTNAIILIPREAVSRAIKPENYNHGLWIRWTIQTTPLGSSRMLSPITGHDWKFDGDDPIRTQGTELGSPLGLVGLPELGLLEARKNWVGDLKTVVLRRIDGTQDPNALMLGMGADGKATELRVGDPIPSGALVIGSARSWDDVPQISKLVDGNTLVVSYPPPSLPTNSTLSAAWLLGRDDVPVPASTRVIGLLPAAELITLVTRPEAYSWHSPTEVSAEQWMKKIDDTRTVQLVSLFFFALVVAMWTLRSIASESGGKLARFGIAMVPCAFISVFLSGNFAKATGLMSWNILPFFTYFALMLGALPAYLAMRALWPRSHALYPITLFCAAILLWAEPRFTIFSEVFTSAPLPVSPIALGALIAAMTATVSLSFSGGVWPRLLAGALLCVAMGVGGAGHQWWAPDLYLLILPVLALVSGAGVMRAYFLPVLVIWPFLYHHWNGHFWWDPNWLLSRYRDMNAINAGVQVRFLLSPVWLVTLVTFASTSLFGGDFLKHQLRRSFAETGNARGLFWAALGVACLGIREPYLLVSALVVFITGLLVLLFDATGTG